jgi:hypothetical protein
MARSLKLRLRYADERREIAHRFARNLREVQEGRGYHDKREPSQRRRQGTIFDFDATETKRQLEAV